jgi:hypothetical protein
LRCSGVLWSFFSKSSLISSTPCRSNSLMYLRASL